MMVKNRRAILIGILPPPITGQGISFTTSVHFVKEAGISHSVVNLGTNDENRSVGSFSWQRAKEVLYSLGHYLLLVWRPNQVVYLCLAISKIGFARDFVFILLGKVFGHRIVLHMLGGGYDDWLKGQSKIFQKIVSLTLGCASIIIVESDLLKNQTCLLKPGKPEIKVIHNCLTDNYVNTNPKMLQPDEPLRVLFLSNLIESKGYWDVFQAVKSLHNAGYNVRVDFCGIFISEPHEKEAINSVNHKKEAFLQTIRSAENMSFMEYHGLVDGDAKHQIFEKADVFALPTYYPKEGQPLSMLEALSYGLPIISTSYRSIPDMLKDGMNGFFVNPRSPQEISEKLETLIKCPSLLASMRSASLALYQEQFQRSTIEKRLVQTIMDTK